MKIKLRSLPGLSTLLVLLALCPGAARAAALVWDGSANGLWTNAANWAPAFRPTNGDALLFPDGVAQKLVTNSPAGATNYHSITIASSNYVLRSSFLALTNGLTNSGPVGATNTVIARVVLRTNQTWDVAGKTALVLASNLNFTNLTLTLNNDGVLEFNSAIGAAISAGASSFIVKTGVGQIYFSRGDANFNNLHAQDGTVRVDTVFNAGLNIGPGASLTGTGILQNILCAGDVRPGVNGPGVLTLLSVGSTFQLGSSITFDLDGTVPGTGYDQLRVTNPPSLNAATLLLSPGYNPFIGDSFVIITNTGTNLFTTAFLGRPEGSTQIVNGVQYRVSYVGGNGNDVTLTVAGFEPSAITRLWDGAGANAFWLNATNWSNNVAPIGGQSLFFPAGALAPTNTNDFPAGTSFNHLTFAGNYTVDGAALKLLGGIEATQPAPGTAVFRPITTFSGAQTVRVENASATLQLGQPQRTNTLVGLLTLEGPGKTVLPGSINGSGGLDIFGPVDLFGTNSTYLGQTRVAAGGVLNINSSRSLGEDGGLNFTVVDAGGTLQISAALTNQEVITLSGSLVALSSFNWGSSLIPGGSLASLDIASGQTGQITGPLNGTAPLVIKSGAGTLRLDAPTNDLFGTLANVGGGLLVNGTSLRMNLELTAGVLGGTGAVRNITLTGGTLQAGLNRFGTFTCSNLAVSSASAVLYVNVSTSTNNVLRVRNGVQLDGTLIVATVFPPAMNVPFVIIDNMGPAPVSGTFSGLLEGSSLVFSGLTYRVSYVGGDGNDVTLELISVASTGFTRVWDAGGNDNYWSNPTNWSGNTLPAAGDSIQFPANLALAKSLTTNDLPSGFFVDQLVFRDGTGGIATQLRGNGLSLLNGVLATNTTDTPVVGLALDFESAQTVLVTGPGLTFGGSLFLAGDLTVSGGGGTIIINGDISGPGGLLKTTGGGLTLAAANTFAGAVNIQNGGLLVAHPQALGASGGGTFIGAGASLQLQHSGTLTESQITVTGQINGIGTNSVAGEIVLPNFATAIGAGVGSQLTLSGPLTGAGSPQFQGGGNFVLSGTNLCAAETQVQNSTLRVNGRSTAGSLNATVGGTLGGTGVVGQLSVQNSGVLSPGASPGALTSGNLQMFSGTTLLFEFNSATPGTGYDQLLVTGSVSLSNPTLQLAPGFAPVIGTVFTLIVNDGVDAVSGTFNGLPEGALLSTNGINLQISYVGGDGNDVTLTRVLIPTGFTRVWDGGGANGLWSNRTNWVSDALPVEGDRLVFPSGSLRPNNTNDFPALTGFDSISVGATHNLNGAAVLLQSGLNVTSGSPATVSLDVQLNAPQTFTSGSGLNWSLNRALVLGPHTLTFAGNGVPTVNGPISGAGGIIKSGSGTLTFNGTNSYDGFTDLVEGTLAAGHGTALGTANAGTLVRAGTTLRWLNAVTVFEPLTLDGFTGTPAILQAQSGSNVFNASIALTGITPFCNIEVNGAEMRVNGVISGGGFIKFGTGTLVLAGANTITGDTRLENGTLLVNGAQPSSALLMSGGTAIVFGGTGTVASLSGTFGTVSPGQSPGRLTVAGTFFGNATRTNFYELNGPVAGSGYDQLVVQGNVQLNSTPLRVAFGYTPAFGDAFTLIDNQGLNPVVGTFAGLPEGVLITNGAVVARLTYMGGTGNDVVLTRIAVPTGVTRVWDGGGVDNNWSTPANWVGDVAPQQGDSIVFPITAIAKSPTFDAGTNAAFNSLTFGSNYTVNVAAGHSLRLIAGISATNASGVARFFVPVILENNQTWSVQQPGATLQARAVDLSLATLNHSGAGNLELLGPVTGSGGLSGNSSGNLFVSGTNTFSGTVTINSGTLTVLSPGALGTAGASTFIGTAGRLALDLPDGQALAEPMILAGRVEMVAGVTNLLTGTLTLAGTQVAFDSANNSRLEIHGTLAGTTFQTLNIGTVVIAGPSSIAGPVRVAGGSRLLVNTPHSAVTFALTNSARLGGSGPVAEVLADACAGCSVEPGPVSAPGFFRSTNARLIGGNLRVELNGLTPVTDYDQWRVQGTLALTNASLVVTAAFAPAEGVSFRIVDNDDGEPAQGIFNNLPEGALLTNGPVILQISYVGGDGNDVTLTRVTAAPPSLIAPVTLSNGVPVLSGVGLPNLPYVLEATEHLNAPIPWQPILTNTSDGVGAYLFLDLGATNVPMRFYRVRSP